MNTNTPTQIKVEKIDGPDELGNFKVTLTSGSIPLLEKMFPGCTPEEAFNHYWNLATNHLQLAEDQKIRVVKVEESVDSSEN